MNKQFNKTKTEVSRVPLEGFSRITSAFTAWFDISESKANRVLPMEGLRGIAILLVFCAHYYDIIWRDLQGGSDVSSSFFSRLGQGMMGAGATGVDLFFVLSGFLIYGAVRKPTVNLRRFLTRRIQRIYPPFLAVFLLYLALSPFLHVLHDSSARYANRIPPTWQSSLMYMVGNALFLPGVFPIKPIMSVAWSLSYEWFFYLALPCVVLGLGMYEWQRRTRCLTFLAAAVIFLTANLAFPAAFYFPYNPSRESHVEAVMFIGGMLLFEMMEAQRDAKGNSTPWMITRWKTRLLDGAALLLGGAAVIAGGYFGAAKLHIPVPDPQISEIEARLAASLFIGYSVLVLAALTPGTATGRLLSASPIRWLGNMSYSFYLFHGLPLHVLAIAAARAHAGSLSGASLWLAFVAGFPIAFVITSASCAVLFLLVEKPLSLTSTRKKETAAAPPARSSGVIIPSMGS
jgi:peptidoglycan/LPS O-acetylase OafA/YrhL